MNDIYILLLCFISGISTVLGCFFLLIPYKYKDRVISFGFGLSFAVMFLISVLDLIPHGLSLIKNDVHFWFLGLFSFILLFFGMLLVKFCDKRIEGEELLKIGFLSMLSLLIHNIPEGVICAMASYNDFELGLKMIFMIMLHNIPEGICIALPIYYSTKNICKSVMYTLVSGLGEVLGALFTILFLKYFINDFLLYVIFMITAGIMIYLGVKKILITSFKYNCYLWVLIGILIGGMVIFFTI